VNFAWSTLPSLRMEQVFFGLHANCVRAITTALTPKQRVVGVLVLFLGSFSVLAALIHLHLRFCSGNTDVCVAEDVSWGDTDVIEFVVAHQRGPHCDSGVRTDDEQLRGLWRDCDVEHVASYAWSKAYLLLPRDLWMRHHVRVATAVLSAEDVRLGGGTTAWVLRNVVGYETYWMNWALLNFKGRGFMLLTSVGSVHTLDSMYAHAETRSFAEQVVRKVGSLLCIAFLFYVVSTMVSFTLRQTQHKMLRFTYMLEQSVRHGMPYGGLVITHVVDSLVFVPMMVGMLFFLFQFYEDQVLALAILSCVWLSEVYAIIACRTIASLAIFPRAFFCVFSAYHLYVFSFPAGFTHLALCATILVLLLTMAILWNHAEVPALQRNKISAATPRQMPRTLLRMS